MCSPLLALVFSGGAVRISRYLAGASRAEASMPHAPMPMPVSRPHAEKNASPPSRSLPLRAHTHTFAPFPAYLFCLPATQAKMPHALTP